MLHEALTYSQDVDVSKWDFALEIQSLRNERVTDSDLRWLSCKGYVEHAHETTLPTQGRRSFRASGNFTLSQNSCFVLTPDGLRIAQQILNGSATSLEPVVQRNAVESIDEPASEEPIAEPASEERNPASEGPNFEPERSEVVWDAKRRELRVGTQLIKRFRVPAPNQELILSAFEEEGWPSRIDDPLSQAPGIYPKQRLHAAINSLNRNQKIALLRFRGDGNGSGICWEFKSRVES
jgi:hypothetical protein